MTMSPDWRATLSFTDRLSSITRIQASLVCCKLKKSATEAQTEARRLENEAYRLGTSEEDYAIRIQYKIRSAECVPLQGPALKAAGYDSDIDQLLPGGITIGQYTDAVHHRDGIFSLVYKAKAPKAISMFRDLDKGKNRAVAVKVTHPSAMTPPHDSKRESRLLKKAACTFVIPLLESFAQAGGRYVLTFPFMPYDLGTLLRNGQVTPKHARSCLHDLFSALDFIHKAGIIHRDIKPANILLRSPSGPAFLADFGTAWMKEDIDSEPEDEKILDVGTTSYRPPELMFGNQRYGTTLDMWAAGCVAAQMVSLGSKTLFESGDLGSDLALIKSIFETLGTPSLENWPEAATFNDWGKMKFAEFPGKSWKDILPRASEEARDLVANLVVFESKERLTAAKALTHAYLQGMERPTEGTSFGK